jgi:hypothetical protein
LHNNWTKAEKQIAKKVFNLAKSRAYQNLIDTINSKVINSQNQVWELRDLLNRKAKEFDEKFDYRYSQLLILFIRYINEGLLSIEELEGLSEDKIYIIRDITEPLANSTTKPKSMDQELNFKS